jgi:hypothetical protein
MRRRWLTPVALTGCVAVSAAVAGLVTPAWESTRRDIDAQSPARHPTHATQTRTRNTVRTAHLRWAGNRLEDTAAEACERWDVRGWAARLGVAADAEIVARTLAERYYEPATRDAAYEGCINTLTETR